MDARPSYSSIHDVVNLHSGLNQSPLDQHGWKTSLVIFNWFQIPITTMARYHSLPGSSATQPNLFSFGSSHRAAEMLLEFHRAELSQHWDLVNGRVVQHGTRSTPSSQIFYTARQYCSLFDVTRGDPNYNPVTSWSVRGDLRIGVNDKEVVWEPFVFPKSPCKPPVMMIRTTNLNEVREAMLHDRLSVARDNSIVPFDTWEDAVPVVKDFRLINRMEGSVVLMERPSLSLMKQIHKDLLKDDDAKIQRIMDGKVLCLGAAPHFFTEQSIFLGLPTFKDFQDLMLGVRDKEGAHLDTFSSYRDCLAWPFLGIVSAEAAHHYAIFRGYVNAEKMQDAMFETW